jgi:hypothetical protein
MNAPAVPLFSASSATRIECLIFCKFRCWRGLSEHRRTPIDQLQFCECPAGICQADTAIITLINMIDLIFQMTARAGMNDGSYSRSSPS